LISGSEIGPVVRKRFLRTRPKRYDRYAAFNQRLGEIFE
jgi:hypothetical protein